MMRFVETGSGKPYSSFKSKAKQSQLHSYFLIGLEADRKIIYNRINQRVDITDERRSTSRSQTLFLNKS
jgi:tRNA dimethylallyltransferase